MESLIILAITFALLWVLLVLPRRRWQQAHRRMVEALRPGDEVVTSAGIYGTVTELDGDVVHVVIADGVEIRVARMAIGRLADADEAAGTEALGEVSGDPAPSDLEAPKDVSSDGPADPSDD